MKKIVCIVGPTASGKTELAIQIAKYFQTEIINCDSVQMRKQLNIGSAKVTKNEMQGITHHMIDVIEPNQPYSIFDFKRDVTPLIDAIDMPILVGGSGLYLKAALFDYELIENKQKIIIDETRDIKDLITELNYLDPNLQIDFANKRRVVSALRQAKEGQLRSTKHNHMTPLYDVLIIYIDINRDILRERLIKRLDRMMDSGFIEEVQSLLTHHITMNVIGYRELAWYLESKISLEEAKKQIIFKSMQYAKRQKTFFKHQMDVEIVNYDDPDLVNKTIKHVLKFIGE